MYFCDADTDVESSEYRMKRTLGTATVIRQVSALNSSVGDMHDTTYFYVHLPEDSMCWQICSNDQNPLHTFPRNLPVDAEAANLLKPDHTGDYSRRFRRQFVAENGDCRRKVRRCDSRLFWATVALFCDSVDRALRSCCEIVSDTANKPATNRCNGIWETTRLYVPSFEQQMTFLEKSAE